MKDIITSSSNELIKEINKLKTKKYRTKSGKFIIETRKLIEEAINSNWIVEKVLTREDAKVKFSNSIMISKNLFNDLSYLQQPDGYMAIVVKKEFTEITDKVLVLDNIQDPGNVGTLIRSAEAFGYNTVIGIDSCDFFNEKVLRSTMGSVFRLNLIESSYEKLKTQLNHTIFIADMDGEDYRNIKENNRVCIVIGNEGNGISREIQNLPHKKVKIPMQGNIESLNAGISGAILMSAI